MVGAVASGAVAAAAIVAGRRRRDGAVGASPAAVESLLLTRTATGVLQRLRAATGMVCVLDATTRGDAPCATPSRGARAARPR